MSPVLALELLWKSLFYPRRRTLFRFIVFSDLIKKIELLVSISISSLVELQMKLFWEIFVL